MKKSSASICANLWFIASLFLCSPALLADEFKLHDLFTDHMVLQRDRPVPVWGTAKPGAPVDVAFGGQKKSAKADAGGFWMVKLDPLPAALEGRELTAQSGSENRTLTDVVVGDVWLCSGQSNMHFTMKQVPDAKSEIAAANNGAIRFFYPPPQFAQEPRRRIEGRWDVASPESVAQCSAVAYYFARDLQPRLGVPVGLLLSSVGGTRIESWMAEETLTKLEMAAESIKKWKAIPPKEFAEIVEVYEAYQHQKYRVYPEQVRAARSQGAPVPPEPPRPEKRPHDCPNALHNAMIAPLQPFALRGALWYQGEGNIGSPGGYEKMLPAMIADWRDAWGAKMPFLIVQLPPHESITPQFREAQFRIWESTPHTAMVVTTDVGDAKDLHPPRKRPVGERLALAARALSYGEDVEFSGPVFQNMKIEGDRAVVAFRHTAGGLEAKGGPLKGFTIAGADGKFVPAQAEIQGETVAVFAGEVAQPKAVRYGWDKVPDVNLLNRAGLPAVPFRSDPPATAPKP